MIFTLAAAAVLSVSGFLHADPPVGAEGEAGAFVGVVVPEKDVFPSFAVTAARMEGGEKTEAQLGEANGLLAVGVVCPADGTPVKVVISAPAIMEDSSFDGVMAREGETYSIAPKVLWKYDRVLRSTRETPVDITFKVKVGATPWREVVKTCTLRGVEECLLAFDVGGAYRTTPWLLAAYVDEDSRWVEGVMKDALAIGVVQEFTGYESNDPEEVLKQVYAVWRALEAQGVRCRASADAVKAPTLTLPDEERPKVVSRRVRLMGGGPARGACDEIDGVVMLASVLRKIGIQTHMGLAQGRAFLTFRPHKDVDDEVGVDLSKLGLAPGGEFEQQEARLTRLFASLTGDASAAFASFEAAVTGGSALHRDNLHQFSQSDIDPSFMLVSLDEARQMGVRALPSAPTPARNETRPGRGEPRGKGK